MGKLSWKDDAKCLDMDVNMFFDKYEEDIGLRAVIDRMCASCPVSQKSLTTIRQKRYGMNFSYN